MRVGILGGSFDPVHYGHLLLAESAREELRLDEVWLLPAAIAPHKQDRRITGGPQRCEMIELAISGYEPFRLCRYEIDRGGVNYTVDTLAHLSDEDPSRELFFLMGADSLADLPTWKDPARLLELCIPAVVARAGGKPIDYSVLEPYASAERIDLFRKHQFHMPAIELSSSDIRARASAGKSIRYRTPRAVEKYVETQQLYRALQDR